jgi:hypothetical protein
MSLRLCRLLFAIACLTAASSAGASSVQQLSLERLSREADVIVRGRVAEITNRAASERRPATTVIKIDVERQLKGPPTAALTVAQPGGAEADISLGVAGAPKFSPGEDLIVFVKRRRANEEFRIVGGKQGKFTVLTDPVTNRQTVEDLARRVEPLEHFLARLAGALQRN